MTSRIKVQGGNGILLSVGTRTIALDPLRQSEAHLTFISHAHIDHLHKSTGAGTILTSKETAYLAKERGFSYNNVVNKKDGLELLDSGHILGSRGLLIDNEVFYTGDFALRPRAFLNRGETPRCEVLIMDSTFGTPSYKFPPLQDVIEETNKIIGRAFDKGRPVVLMGYPLGKAQLLTYLFSMWEPVYVHESVQRMNRAHSVFGIDFGKEYQTYTEKDSNLLGKRPWLLISPMRNGRSAMISELKKNYGAITIAFSGWSVNPGYCNSIRADYALTLSDHCDFSELLALVKACKPDRIYTCFGFASQFAAYLREEGHNATPITGGQKFISEYVQGR